MNKLYRYILIGVSTAIILFIAWYFSSILSSVLIAAVLSFVGKPIMEFLTKVQYKRFRLSSTISSILTLIFICGVITALILFFAPLIGTIIKQMGNINLDEIGSKLSGPLAMYNESMHNLFPTMDKEVTIETMILAQVKGIFSFSLFTNAFGSVASFFTHLFITAFTVIFVTFFFLKDSNMFSNIILTLVPSKYEESTSRAINNSTSLLTRYFTGICLETILITILNTMGLYFICDVNFQLAVVLAFLSGVLNVIPYIGPLCGGAFGTIMGVITHLGEGSILFWPLIIKLILVFAVTHIIDVFIFQPYIYSNSVKAHPLEIFLVILIAGNIGGIIGMLIAIPCYTVIRVFAKEFLSNIKVVKKLTDNL